MSTPSLSAKKELGHLECLINNALHFIGYNTVTFWFIFFLPGLGHVEGLLHCAVVPGSVLELVFCFLWMLLLLSADCQIILRTHFLL